MYHRARRVHLVGIGGSGMSGIAELLLDLGYRVSGSDLASTPITSRLADRGAVVRVGHDADHVRDVDVVVVSTAVPRSNPEVEAASARRIPVIQRAEMLAELMRLKHGVVVAGSHGKTTTSAMVTVALTAAGLDPTSVIGGQPVGWMSSARVGASDLLVAEADESDGSFLHLPPTFALITNIDPEHLEHYGGDPSALDDAFVEFSARVPFWGSLTLCADDAGVQRILPRVNRRFVRYGASDDADLRLTDVQVDEEGTTYRVRPRGGAEITGHLSLFGRHNALNALGAMTLARELGVAPAISVQALAEFRGVDRRFTVRGEIGGVRVVDDYAHHPTEIRATLEAARSAHPGRRIRVGFQPHRFSRTRDLMNEFAASFGDADEVVLTPVYAAGEAPVEGATSTALADRLAVRGAPGVRTVPDLDALVDVLSGDAREGDLVLLLGAGDVHRCAVRILAQLAGAPAQDLP
jgi:UDP-N-acetylmuramate--alanine ligase